MRQNNPGAYSLKANIILFLAFSAILPFLLLSFFNHPSSDDFCIASRVNAVGFLKTQVQTYKGSSGLYFGTALHGIQPLTFNWMVGYKIIPFLVIILFSFALFSFIKEFTSPAFTTRENLLMSLSLFALYLYGMPSVPEGFYWYTGMAAYQVGNILLLFFLIVIIRFCTPKRKGNRQKLFILAVLLIIAIVGLNLITTVLLSLLLLSLFVIRTARTKTVDWFFAALLLVAGIASTVVIVAPGFEVRSTTAHSPYKHDIFFALSSSADLLGNNIYQWIVHTPLLLLTLLYIPYGGALANEQRGVRNFFSLHPIVALSLYGLFLIALFFPYTWATGEANPPGRVSNIVYLFFLIGWFVNVQGFINAFSTHSSLRIDKLPCYAQWIVLLMLLMSLTNANNITTAYGDLLKGTAYGYNEELNARYNALKECAADSCALKKLEHHPGTVFYADITEDEKDWQNACYANFFGKKATRISAMALSEGAGRCESSPFLPLDMAIPLEVNYGGKIKLWGATTVMPSKNRMIISHYWQRLESLGSYTTVFVHFTDAKNRIILWKQYEFCQRLHFEESRGRFIRETFEVSIPDSVKGTEVFMKVGIITQEPILLNRLRIEAAGGVPTDDNSTRAIIQKLKL